MIVFRTAILAICSAVVAASGASAQSPGGWVVEGSRSAPPYRLTLPDAGKGVSYIFDCSGQNLLVTETGVTELLDIKASVPNTRVPDTGEGRVMPEGSALLAIFTGRGDPDFKLGSAKANPLKGWDITIELPRTDKVFQNLGKADMLSLFSTGYTALVALEKADRKTMTDFVKECRK